MPPQAVRESPCLYPADCDLPRRLDDQQRKMQELTEQIDHLREEVRTVVRLLGSALDFSNPATEKKTG